MFGGHHHRQGVGTRVPPGPRTRAMGLGGAGEGEGDAHQVAALVVWLRRHGVNHSDTSQFCKVRGMGVARPRTFRYRHSHVSSHCTLFVSLVAQS
jgi:hypothetical protein